MERLILRLPPKSNNGGGNGEHSTLQAHASVGFTGAADNPSAGDRTLDVMNDDGVATTTFSDVANNAAAEPSSDDAAGGAREGGGSGDGAAASGFGGFASDAAAAAVREDEVDGGLRLLLLGVDAFSTDPLIDQVWYGDLWFVWRPIAIVSCPIGIDVSVSPCTKKGSRPSRTDRPNGSPIRSRQIRTDLAYTSAAQSLT